MKFLKRVAEMAELSPVVRTLPRIKRHLFNPENMRWAPFCPPARAVSVARVCYSTSVGLLQVRRQRHPAEDG